MHDPYDMHVAFDDVYGAPEYTHVDSRRSSDLQRALWRRVARKRYDNATVLGSDLSGLRLDDATSYAAFREQQRASYVDELKQRLLQLELAFAQHVADGHGGHVDVLGAAVIETAHKAKHGGKKVPVARALVGRVECWQDDKDIHCTVKVRDADGEIKYATGTMPLDRIAHFVVDAARETDVDVHELLGCGPDMIRVVGGEALLKHVCGLAPSLLAAQPDRHARNYLRGCDILVELHGRN